MDRCDPPIQRERGNYPRDGIRQLQEAIDQQSSIGISYAEALQAGNDVFKVCEYNRYRGLLAAAIMSFAPQGRSLSQSSSQSSSQRVSPPLSQWESQSSPQWASRSSSQHVSPSPSQRASHDANYAQPITHTVNKAHVDESYSWGICHPDKRGGLDQDMRVKWSDAEVQYVRHWLNLNAGSLVRVLYDDIHKCPEARKLFHPHHIEIDKLSYIYKKLNRYND